MDCRNIYREITCKSALSPSKLPDLKYSLNPYLGCGFGCVYCYARHMSRNPEISNNWGKLVFVKINVADVLKKEVKKVGRGVVGISTVTDPYQPAEAKYNLTRKCIEILIEHCFHISIQTKSALSLKDKDIISDNSDIFDVGVTITTFDNKVAKMLEPCATPPKGRVRIIETYASLGVETWIFYGPIIPSINDDEWNIEEIAILAKDTKSMIIYDKLNLKPPIYKYMQERLAKDYPDLISRLPKLVARNSEYWKGLSKRIKEICGKYDVECKPAFPEVSLVDFFSN